MYGQGWVVSNADLQRIRKEEKRREEQKKKYEEQQKQGKDKVSNAGLRQFGVSTSEALDNLFKNETVGLVTRDEFVQKKATLQDRIEEEKARAAREAEEAALKQREARRKEKARKAAERAKLSFMGDDDEQQEEEEQQQQQQEEQQQQAGSSGEEGPSSKRPRYGKFGKDPSVATSFLPDRDLEREEEELRAALKKEWQLQQGRVKGEPLEVTYSYWDGQGHRRKVVVKKGDSIGTFLKAVRDQLGSEFRELRRVSLDNLMYVKEDIILPHHLTFYDLIINKARGKSGPLFNFSVHEEVRIVNDATVEKEDSHAGKVVERHWYDKNKHIFPASRWETFDPDKVYERYSVKGA